MTRSPPPNDLESNHPLDSLTYEELRSKIIGQYSKSGVLKSLRTQLRSKILLDIQRRGVIVDNYINDENTTPNVSQYNHEDSNVDEYKSKTRTNNHKGESQNGNQSENSSYEEDIYGFDTFGSSLKQNSRFQKGTRISNHSQHSKSVQQSRKGQQSTSTYAILKKESSIENADDLLKLQVLYSILFSFLKQHSLNYTISVLLSEADVSEQLVHSNSLKLLCEMFRREELPFNEKNKKKFSHSNFVKGNTNAIEMLYELVVQLLNTTSIHQGIQTEGQNFTKNDSVDEKLKALDEKYLNHRAVDEANIKSIEERMLEFQRNCELRSRKEIEEKMAFFEETTLSTMRLEESAKYREKIAVMKEKFENEYSVKIKELHRREIEMKETMEARQKELEKSSHEHRQNMMKEITKLQNKQNQMRKAELEIERSRQEITEKSRRLEVLHQQTSIDMKTELSVLKQNLESKYEQDYQELEVQRQMFEKEKVELQLMKEAIDNTYKAHGNVSQLKETIEQQAQTIATLRNQIADLRLENKHLKTICDELRHENSQFRYVKDGNIPTQLHLALDQKYETLLREKKNLEDVSSTQLIKIQDLMKRNEILEKEHAQILQKFDIMNKTSQNDEQLKQLQAELQRERNNSKLLVSKWGIEKTSLSDKIVALEEAQESLHREFDEEKLRTKKLSMELLDSQTLLRETQQALDNALKSDSSIELQSLLDRKERLIKELQRELEQAKQEKQGMIRELNLKLEEETRHSTTLKEALAQNQKMLEKAQASFNDITVTQDQLSRQNQSERNKLEEKYSDSLRMETEKFENQLKLEKERNRQLESKKQNIEKELEKSMQEIDVLQNEKSTLENALKECEDRVQNIIRQADLPTKQLQNQIEEQFLNHIRTLNADHAGILKEKIGFTIENMLHLLGNPQKLASVVHTQEKLLGIQSTAHFNLSQTVPTQSKESLSTQPIQQTTQAPKGSPDEIISSPTLASIETSKLPPSHTQQTFISDSIPPTQTTNLNIKEADQSVQFLSTDTEHPASKQVVISDSHGADLSSPSMILPTELEVEESIQQVKKAESPTLKSFTEEYVKQRQEERFDDDFHLEGLEESDLEFVRSDEDDLEDILGSDNDDEFF